MTPLERRERYGKVLAFCLGLEKCLKAGMAGDAAARTTFELFEAIPDPLRSVLAREGVQAYNRLQKTEGPIADCIDRIFRKCKEDQNYKRRAWDFWDCLRDPECVEDGEDRQETPGERENEEEVPIRLGAPRSVPSEQEGAPRSEFVYPDDGPSEASPEAEPAEALPESTGESDALDDEDDAGGDI